MILWHVNAQHFTKKIGTKIDPSYLVTTQTSTIPNPNIGTFEDYIL
jgi:hypothetical protein